MTKKIKPILWTFWGGVDILRGRNQRYKCKDCGRRFDGGIRRDKSQVITDYVEGKQPLEQFAIKYGVNEKAIRRDLKGTLSY